MFKDTHMNVNKAIKTLLFKNLNIIIGENIQGKYRNLSTLITS